MSDSTDYSSLLRSELRRVEVEVEESAIQQLVLYCAEVERWNRKINLTSLQGRAFIQRLLVEPIWIARKLRIAGTVCDVGSGNGSPAIPIRLTQPMIQSLHLTEIRVKKAAFLRHVTSLLQMNQTYVHRERFEDAIRAVGTVDWITLQAVDPSESILEACRAISSDTTRVVWITSEPKQVAKQPESILELPFSETRAVIFSSSLSLG